MADGAINYNLDSQDDPVLPDMVPSFEGGQFSNLRANLLQQNQSKVLGNCDITRLGHLRSRRGTTLICNAALDTPAAVSGKIIQGLTSYQTPDANYIVAAQNKKLWAWTGSAWVQIALGGTADDEDILIARTGLINNLVVGPPPENGYPMGTTVIAVDTISGSGVIGVGEKLYFNTNIRNNYYEYTVAAVSGGPPVTSITLEEPGLVFDVKDNWKFTGPRPAKVNHPTPGNRYAGGVGTGATGIDISVAAGFGAVGTGEKFVIKSENITHTITTHTETAGDTSHINFSTDLQSDWPGAGGVDASVMFAQGNDALYFTDGVGPIYGWKGGIPSSPTTGGGTLTKIGSHSLLDDLSGDFVQGFTAPPQNVKVLLWFQNRLIASGIAAEPDAIYFSDFFDATSWDRNYQKIRIGGGESDPITGLLAWTDYNLIVFKKNSIYVINLDPAQNPDPNDPTLLIASFAVKQLHKLIGCPAPMSAVQVGGGSTTPGSDVFFVDGDKKVHSIRRVMAAETQQEVGQAMSLPIQDVMDTINLAHVDRCVAMYHNEHYILGIPSMRGFGGGTYPNAVVAYNLLTQSWCGVWGWAPTCFARRTDLGSYSKLVFGETVYDSSGGVDEGHVVQWMDDLSLEEETETTYQDRVPPPIPGGDGNLYQTQILTRAFTGGDMYSYKTGLNVEFEFDESVAVVGIKVLLDKVLQIDRVTGSEFIAPPFSTLSEPRLRLPFVVGARLPGSPALLRKSFDLQRYGTWRELQFQINTNADPLYGPTGGKMAIRSIRLTFFMDTMRLQTIPPGFLPSFVAPPDLPLVEDDRITTDGDIRITTAGDTRIAST